jgi:[ribosomal protein S18]-alanine N-acetyltransferase
MGGEVTSLEIREFSPSDVAQAAVMESANQPQPWTERIFRDELSVADRVYLAADDGRLVGYGGVMVVGDEAHITNLLVADSERGRGVGKKLMAGLVDAALGLGARHLTLEVGSKNAAARALYSSFGLAPVGVRKDYYGDDDALIMWVHDIDGPEYAKQLESLRRRAYGVGPETGEAS